MSIDLNLFLFFFLIKNYNGKDKYKTNMIFVIYRLDWTGLVLINTFLSKKKDDL